MRDIDLCKIESRPFPVALEQVLVVLVLPLPLLPLPLLLLLPLLLIAPFPRWRWSRSARSTQTQHLRRKTPAFGRSSSICSTWTSRQAQRTRT